MKPISNIKKLSLIISLITITGCASKPHPLASYQAEPAYTQAETNEQFFEVSNNMNHQIQQALNIVNQPVFEMREQLGFEIIGEVSQPVIRTNVSGEVDVTFDINMTAKALNSNPYQAFFAPGRYHLINSKGGKIFLSYVTYSLSLLANVFQSYPNSIEVEAHFLGSADGMPTGPNLKYDGRYGQINQLININGSNTQVQISQGQHLSNQLLASLRAYSGLHYFKQYQNEIGGFSKTAIRYKLVANTHKQQGSDFRFLKVSFTVTLKK